MYFSNELPRSDIAKSTPSGMIRGLDGLRAVAVVAVLFYHAHCAWMRGGYLGVEVFFVISGFLITGLLLKENDATGQIRLLAFWIRRLKRLVPALVVFLFGLCAFGLFFLGPQAAQFREDLLASLLYAENWHQIGSGSSYFADQGLPLLRHLWSLSLEGQFYLFWPFLVVGATRWLKGRIWPLAAFTAILAAVSFGLMLHLADPWNPSGLAAAASLNRAYLGTDTRAFSLLVGALLAMVTLRSRRTGPGLDWALNLGALAALGALSALLALTDLQTAFLFHGGFLLVDACTLLVIAALVLPRAGWMGKVLGFGPLEWLGQRSYGLYLWHWPVFLLVAPGQETLDFWALRLALALVLTELSYRFLETPVRQGALGRLFSRRAEGTRTRRILAFAGLALVAAAALSEAVAMARLPIYVDPVAASIKAGEAALDQSHAGPASIPPAPSATAHLGPNPQALGSQAPSIPLPEGLEGLRVTAIGDSVMKGAALNLKKAGDLCLGQGMMLINAEESRSFRPALEILRTYKKEDRLGEVVVIHLGTNNSSIAPDQFRKVMDLLADRRLVLFLTVKSDKVEACDTVNRTLEVLLTGYPNARIFDWRTAAESHPNFFYTDRTHLRPEGAQYYAGMILAQISLHAKDLPARTLAMSRVK